MKRNSHALECELKIQLFRDLFVTLIRRAFHCAPSLSHNSGGSNLDDLTGLASCATEALNLLYEGFTLIMHDLAEHDMPVIEPTGDHGGDEELRAVGVGAGIGHREQKRAVVLLREVLI